MANIIREAVSGIAGVFAPGFDTLVQEFGEPDRLSLQAKPSTTWPVGGVMAYGETDPSVPAITGDKTIAVKANVPDADFATLWECAAMRLTCTPDSGGWKAGALVFSPTGTESCLSGVLDLNVDYHLAATYEAATGEIVLYVDGVVANSVSFGGARETIIPLPIWRMGGPPEAIVTDAAVWSRMLTANELPGFVPVHFIQNVVGWWTAEDYVDFATTPTLNDRIGTCDLSVPNSIGKITDADFAMQVLTQPGGGANSYLQNTTDNPLSGLSSFGLTFVAQAENPGGVFADFRNTANAQPHCFFFGSSNPYQMVSTGTLSGGVNGDNDPHVWYFEWNGAACKIYVDGSLYATGTLTSNTATASITLGNTYNIGGAMGWLRFAEAKVSTGAQSGGDILAEANALRAKWGL